MASRSVTVIYCASCNYLSRALWMAGEILSEASSEIADLRLVPGDRGVFDWFVNDRCVFSKGDLGRFPELDELKEAIYEQLHG